MSTYQSMLPDAPSPEALAAQPVFRPFEEGLMDFVSAFSEKLLHSPAARQHPDLVALAYWARRASLVRMRAAAACHTDGALLVPQGSVLHIAPSNVETIFIYSWFLSLLSGNRNIVRLPSKRSAQSDLLLDTAVGLLADDAHSAIARSTLLVRYGHDAGVTARLSAVCDVRVVWGGDQTVQEIRQVALPPTAREIAFPGKYSLAVINVAAWLEASPAQKDCWAAAFHADAYWFNQMACSSPRLVLWLGDSREARRAGAEFWGRLEDIVALRTARMADGDYVSKFVATNVLAIEANGTLAPAATNDLTRVWLDTPALHANHHCGAGLFLESAIDSLDALRPVLDRSVQTVAYAGFTREQMQAFVGTGPLRGIDRIVPFGKALSFSAVWDGQDLARAFLRHITVE